MLAIKLSRKGKTKEPTFRLIVCEKTKDPWGTYLENVGIYNPRTKELKLEADRIKYWLSKGAQPSATIWNMLVSKGLVEGKKKKVTKISKTRKEKIAKEQGEAAKTEAAPAVNAPTPAPQA
jgi:small subunit ribosomal protein S16